MNNHRDVIAQVITDLDLVTRADIAERFGYTEAAAVKWEQRGQLPEPDYTNRHIRLWSWTLLTKTGWEPPGGRRDPEGSAS